MAAESHAKLHFAQQNGHFNDEIVPVKTEKDGAEIVVNRCGEKMRV